MLKNTRFVCRAAAFVCLLGALMACNGQSQDAKRDLGTLASLSAPQADAWNTFLSGDTEGAKGAFDLQSDDPWTLYGGAEALYLDGDYNGALDAHLMLLQKAPASALASFSLLRMQDLRALADNFDARTRQTVGSVRTNTPGAPPLKALTRHLANDLAFLDASRRWYHSLDDKPFDGSALGVPSAWRVAGPTSVRGLLDIDEPTQFEANNEPLPEQPELLGFKRDTKLALSSGKSITIDQGPSGVYVAETWLALDKDARFDLSGSFEGVAMVFIDGQEVMRRDDRAETVPTQTRTRGLALSKGVHRVLVRAAVDRGYKDSVGLVFLPVDPSVKMAFTALKPEGKAGSVKSKGTASSWMGDHFGPELLKGQPQLQILAGQLSIALGDEVNARQILALMDENAPDYDGLPLMKAELASVLWTLPGEERREAILLALQEAVERDVARARLWQASIYRGQKLKEAAGKQVQWLLNHDSTQSAHWLEAARYYGWRQFRVKHEQALKKALELDPNDCYTADLLYDVWAGRDYHPEPQDFAPMASCRQLRSRYHNTMLTRRGEYTRYMEGVALKVKRRPDIAGRWLDWAKGARQHQSVEAAMEILKEGLKHHRHNTDLVLALAGLLEHTGDRDGARRIMQEAVDARPWATSLHERLALMEGTLPLEDLLADGQQAIKDFEARPLDLKASAVYVLDYMARRYYQDGTSAEVTHLVTKVLGKEGINDHGEVSFPRNTTPILIRTIKQNGEVIEARFQKGKSTVSMPSLDVGDYIEVAYLKFNGRTVTQQGAFVGPSFYFQMTEIASARSELILEVPEAWDPQVVPRNDAPEAQVSTQNGLRRYRFVQRDSIQPIPEPNAVPKPEFLPHVEFTHRYTWQEAHRSYQESLAGAVALTPLLRARAAEVTEGIEDPSAKVRALFDYVTEHVREKSMQSISQPAAHIEELGAGNPVVLLKVLLKAVGIDSEVMMIQSGLVDPFEGPIPDMNRYGLMALKVTVGEKAPLWLLPNSRWAPYDLLPDLFHEQPALSIEPGAAFKTVQTPGYDPELSVETVSFKAQLDEKGGLSGTVSLVLNGFPASGFRNFLTKNVVAPDKRRKFFEKLLNGDISGAELVEYNIDGLDKRDGKLVLEMRFKRPGYARRDADGTLLIEDRYEMPDITRRYGRLPSRTIPMMITRSTNLKVLVEVSGPEGMRVEGPGGDDEVEYLSPFGSYVRTASRKGSVLKFTQRLKLMPQRIDTTQYPEFVSWSGEIDRATYVRIVMRPDGAQ